MRPAVNWVGVRFGRLIVNKLERVLGPGPGRSRQIWLCQCDCGRMCTTSSKELTSGDTQSCGCLQRQRTIESKSIPQTTAGVNHCCRNYIGSARLRGLSFDLSKDEVADLISCACWYCSKPPKERRLNTRRKSGPILFTANGIDRIDNAEGYTATNSVPCCETCNYMKETMSLSDFLDHIARLQQSIPFVLSPRLAA